MWITVPDYFTSFKCIADKCRDSCCIGWEIDIDDDARLKYDCLNTPIGAEIREKTPHGYFPLDKNGHCAFLDCKGLCRIVSELGEGYLCDICNEHPRYYGVGIDGFEGGIGLGCEEAARIILSLEKKPRLIEIEREIPYYDEDNKAFVSEYFRCKLYDRIFSQGIEKLVGSFVKYAKSTTTDDYYYFTSEFSRCMPAIKDEPLDDEKIEELIKFTFTLLDECEALSDEWHDLVYAASKVRLNRILKKDKEIRGLCYYFTHRYVRECVYDKSLGKRILFAIMSSLAIAALSEVIDGDDKEVRAAVLYSKNVEYSTDNIDMILSEINLYK